MPTKNQIRFVVVVAVVLELIYVCLSKFYYVTKGSHLVLYAVYQYIFFSLLGVYDKDIVLLFFTDV